MITIDELIKRDLYRDYRTYTDHDDSDWPSTFEPPVEVSDANISLMIHYFGMIRNDSKSILEIGVGNKNERSFTKLLLDNKLSSTKYFDMSIVFDLFVLFDILLSGFIISFIVCIEIFGK